MIPILYEDKYIIAVHKPSGMPVMKDRSRDMDLVSFVESDLGLSELALINRLDRPVSGVVLLAKDKTTQKNLMQQVQNREVNKIYLAWVEGLVNAKETIILEDYMIKTAKSVALIVSASEAKAKKASLSYKVLESKNTQSGYKSLLEINLLTGRFHQIRAQLAHHGMPVVGDTKYNDAAKNIRGWQTIQLVAFAYTFTHPVSKKTIKIEVEEIGLTI